MDHPFWPNTALAVLADSKFPRYKFPILGLIFYSYRKVSLLLRLRETLRFSRRHKCPLSYPEPSIISLSRLGPNLRIFNKKRPFSIIFGQMRPIQNIKPPIQPVHIHFHYTTSKRACFTISPVVEPAIKILYLVLFHLPSGRELRKQGYRNFQTSKIRTTQTVNKRSINGPIFLYLSCLI